MNLQHLQYIVEIANCGSISKAAQTLYVSQPYLSKILREVESTYHLSIFSRDKNGIELTESGRLFVDMANDLLENAARFQKEFEDRRDSYRLRVISGTFSHSMDAFLRMVDSLPDNNLRFSYRESHNILDIINEVHAQKADIGVLSLNNSNYEYISKMLDSRRIAYHKLFETGTWIAVGENHPLISKTDSLTIEDLYEYNLVLYPTFQDSDKAAMESIYNDASLKIFDLNRFKQIIYVHSRAALHNVLTRTNFIGIGTAPARDQENGFHIHSIPLPLSDRTKEIIKKGTSLYYIHLKDKELPKAASAYITFLESYYGERSDYMDSF